jgi:hypothetical protein
VIVLPSKIILCEGCTHDMTHAILVMGNYHCDKCGKYQHEYASDSIGSSVEEFDTGDGPRVETVEEVPGKVWMKELKTRKTERESGEDSVEDNNKQSGKDFIQDFIQQLSGEITSEDSVKDDELHCLFGKDFLKEIIENNSPINREQVELFVDMTNQLWDRKVLYFKGDVLHRMNVIVGSGNSYCLSIMAKESNVGIQPIAFFSEIKSFGDLSPWVILLTTGGGEIWMCGRLDEELNKIDTDVMTEWYSVNDEILVCVTCDKQYPRNSSLHKDSHVPMRGFCTSCHSRKFVLEMVVAGKGATLMTIIYDVATKKFYESVMEQEDALDIDEIWAEYKRTDSIDTTAVGAISDSVKEIIRLELKLHQSSAALYAKLRVIPLSDPNRLKGGVEVLRELRWLNDQVTRLEKRIG